jgi:hypothetical protein
MMVKVSKSRYITNPVYLRGVLMGAILAVGANAWLYALQGYQKRKEDEERSVKTIKQTLLNTGDS